MSEILHVFQGPRGAAEVHRVVPDSNPSFVRWEVLSRGTRYPCSGKGQAVILAMHLAGTSDESMERVSTASGGSAGD